MVTKITHNPKKRKKKTRQGQSHNTKFGKRDQKNIKNERKDKMLKELLFKMAEYLGIFLAIIYIWFDSIITKIKN